ncbi:MAG: hypothetical protein EOO52_06525 [Gammaproteobacteria bacterium]|nr:MAG: hypothetical protein EOO52_06525 [Gammaproteobacteria bacterium]
MEHRYIVHYTLDGQDESLEVITDSESLTFEEARKKVEAAAKPYGKTDIENIKVVKVDVADVINTDPQTSASE